MVRRHLQSPTMQTTHTSSSKTWLVMVLKRFTSYRGIVQPAMLRSTPPKSKVSAPQGSHVQVWGIDAGTLVDFGNPGEPPILALGIPPITDMHIALTMIHGKRTRALQYTARMWSQYPLSAVGRTLIAKQSMCDSLTYHASFVTLFAFPCHCF
jgi:hypothetical protein